MVVVVIGVIGCDGTTELEMFGVSKSKEGDLEVQATFETEERNE